MKTVIKLYCAVIMVLIIGCKYSSEKLPINNITSIIITPLNNSQKPFHKIYEINDSLSIEKIVNKINSFTEYTEEKGELNYFSMNLINEEIEIYFTILFNKTTKKTKIVLTKNIMSEKRDGFYNCDGLYELIENIVLKYK